MNKITYLILVIFQLIFTDQIKSQDGFSGQCYAKMLTDDNKKDNIKFFVYTGNDDNDIKLDTLFIRYNRGTNQKDEAIYLGDSKQLEDLDIDKDSEDIEMIVFVKDTIQTQNFIEESFNIWIQVLCDMDVSKLLFRIQTELKREGYLNRPFESYNGERTKKALSQYQRDNNLPIGNYNLQTIRKLGVRF